MQRASILFQEAAVLAEESDEEPQPDGPSKANERASRRAMSGAMETLEELLPKAEAAHGHMCPGQILGVRMALLGLRSLGIEDPLGADRKRLITFVEIDRCATDAIGMVTGCRLGKRTLKFRDWGKMAATFVDLAAGRGVRIIALEDSRELARKLFPHIESKSAQQMAAYRKLSDTELFLEQPVRVDVDQTELPGYKGERAVCAQCGEGVNFGRLVEARGRKLCLSCADPQLRYWSTEDSS
jgi:formylmethanofuran dehydrogenase subunit E